MSDVTPGVPDRATGVLLLVQCLALAGLAAVFVVSAAVTGSVDWLSFGAGLFVAAAVDRLVEFIRVRRR